MKKIAFAAAFTAFAGVAAIAQAADLGSLKDAPEYTYSPAALWSGLYIGGHIGGARGNTDITDTYAFNSKDPVLGSTIGKNGFVGGVQLGYNRQTGHLVYGIEADIGKLNIFGKTSAHLQNADNDAKYWGTHRNQLDANYSISGGLYGDITGRLGYATNNTLLYLKGGAAFLNVDASASYKGGDWDGINTFNFSNSDTLWGWTLGVGVQYSLNSRLSLKAEYQHFDFGSMSFDHNAYYERPYNHNMKSTLSGKNDIDVTADAVTVGLNYNLSGGDSGLK
jgi:outer membrane immunogenic protein